MTLREHYTPAQREAAAILDALRGGADIDADTVIWALVKLGETL